MKKLNELRDLRAEKIEALQKIDATASAETRGLTDPEKDKYDSILAEISDLDSDIKRAVKREELAKESILAGSGITHGKEGKEVREYSLTRALAGHINGNLSGLELEMHQEAEKEARDAGASFSARGLMVPSIVLNGTNKRDNSVTMPTQPEDGSAVIRDDAPLPMLAYLTNALVTRQLGARYLTGLRGDLPIDEMAQGAVSTWKGEIEELDKSNIKFATKKMSPHRLGTFAVVSNQFLTQVSPAIEAMLKQELMQSVAREVDRAAIAGSGTNDEPTGILNTAGIGAVALGTNGGAPTYEDIVALEAAVDTQNAATGSLAYLINAATKARLKTTKLDAGSGLYLMPSSIELNGYKVVTSNMVSGDITKGTGTDLSAIIFGNWNDLLIGQWGGLNILTDPYTYGTSGRVRLIVESFWDVMVRRAASFAAIKDAVTTLA